MRIRIATINDSSAIHRIHDDAVKIACKNFYNEEQIRVWLDGRSPKDYIEKINKGEIYVAQEKDDVIGYIHAIPGEIVAIFVDPTLHKKGVGKLLLEHGLKIALKDHKKVKVEATINAESFYRKNGFVKVKDDIYIKKGVESPIVIMEYSNTSANTA